MWGSGWAISAWMRQPRPRLPNRAGYYGQSVQIGIYDRAGMTGRPSAGESAIRQLQHSTLTVGTLPASALASHTGPVSSFWEQHQTAIIVGVVTSVLAAVTTLLVTNIGKSMWNEISPSPTSTTSTPQGRVMVLDWRTHPDSPQVHATASVTVHNDGSATASDCFIYWMTADNKELAASSEFGIAPFQSQTQTLTRIQSSYTGNLLLKKIDTYAFVRCSGQRYPDSPHIQASLY